MRTEDDCHSEEGLGTTKNLDGRNVAEKIAVAPRLKRLQLLLNLRNRSLQHLLMPWIRAAFQVAF